MKVCNLPIEVLALQTNSGVPMPLRFCIKQEEEDFIIKNVKVNSVEEIKIRGEKIYKYTCQNSVNHKLNNMSHVDS